MTNPIRMANKEWIPMVHSEPYAVYCARCGLGGKSDEFILEEADEWECPPCNERENTRERCGGPMTEDKLGDRMKLYERAECARSFMPLLPIVARVDGRSFHSFTRGMDRPYDVRMQRCMVETAIELAKETNSCMVYTQSDEISLAWHSTDPKSSIWFDGRITKMTSQLAAQATLHFYRAALQHLPDFVDRLPTFDARAWQVPNRAEGANVFLWREWDATKNSITMAASAYYSHTELHGKNGAEKHEMLFAKGINWNDYPASFKRGVYVQRRILERPFSADELAALPPKHHARTNPEMLVRRTLVAPIDMPPLGRIANREAVIFEGADPIERTEGGRS